MKTLGKLEDLKPDPRNPRTITPEALKGLTVSLSEFGDISGLVWNQRSGHLVAGHQRLKALREKHGDALNLVEGAVVTPDGERFPVRVVDWPASKEKAANVAANSPLLAGDFTPDLLGILDELKTELPDFVTELRLDELEIPEAPKILSGNESRYAPLRNMPEITRDDAVLKTYEGVEIAVVDFSAGRDSTTAALWAKKHFSRVVLLYADLGAEFPGFALHVHRVAEAMGAELQILLPHTSFWQTFAKKGWPCRLGPWCHKLLHNALADAARKVGPPEKILRITGSRAKQAKAGSTKRADTPLTETPEYQHYAPCYDWTDTSVHRLYETCGLPQWEGYSQGLCRTCCWSCPGQRQRHYAAMRKWYPDLWRELLAMEKRYGIGAWSPLGATEGYLAMADRGESALTAFLQSPNAGEAPSDDLDPGPAE